MLAQRYIGSVIKQSIGEDNDNDSDDGMEDPNEVYAISTVLNLSEKNRLFFSSVSFPIIILET